MSDSWQTLDGIIQKLKDEADARAAQAAQAAAFRAQVPIGPPTQRQAHSAPIGPITQQQAQARGWNPPAPSVQPQQFAVPQAKPLPQVQGPSVQTNTPPISSSQQAPTVQSVTPQYVPKTPTPEVKPAFKASIVQPPQLQQGPQPSPTAVWRGAPPSQPPVGMLPNFGANLAALAPIAGAALQTAWQHPAALLQTIPDMFKATTPPVPQTPGDPLGPMKTAMDIMAAKIAQRHKENQYDKIALPNILKLGADSVTGKSGMVLGMDLLDLMGAAKDIVATIPVGKDRTIGTQFAALRDVGDQMKGFTGAEVWNDPALAGISGVKRGSPADVAYQNSAIANFLTILNPQVWKGTLNMAQYWDIANKRIATALIPTPGEVASNTPEQLNDAKNLAVFMAPNSIANMKATFSEQLDSPSQIADLTKQAADLASQADQEPDPLVRSQKLAEAGRIGAQAAKLRETTPLDLYNKYQNLWYSAPLDFMADPFQIWGNISELSHLTPAARRFAGAEKLMNTAVEGGNESVVNAATELYKAAMQTGRSKAMSDAYTVHDVLTNLLSSLNSKGDIVKGIQAVLGGTIKDGIPLAELNGAEQATQAANGIVPFGWAGVNDYRFQKAVDSFKGVLSNVPNLPSLAGDATEVANKNLVQADILGMLTRAAAGAHDVGVMGEVPWGTKSFEVIPTTGSKAIVQWVGDGKQVLGQSEETTLRAATQMQKSLTRALSTGEEFKVNPIKAVADFRRSIVSSLGLNPRIGQIVANALSGNLSGIMDGGMYELRPLAEKMDELTTKVGGWWPNARLAEDMGGIRPDKAVSYGPQSTNTLTGATRKATNAMTLGLSEWGRSIRQGEGTIAGIFPIGERSMAANIYHQGFTTFFDQKWPEVQPILEDVLKDKIPSTQVQQYVYDRVIQAGQNGDRLAVARAFGDIANGKPAISTRSIAPYVTHVLAHDQTEEIDQILANLSRETLPAAQKRIAEIFETQRIALNADTGAFLHSGPGRYFFTEAGDNKDVADIAHSMGVAAKSLGKSPDEALMVATDFAAMKEGVNKQFMELMQMVRVQPDLAKYMYDAWSQINAWGDIAREEHGNLTKPVIDMAQNAPQASPARIAQAWTDYWNKAPKVYEDYGKIASEIMENVRNDMLSGRAQASIFANSQPTVDITNGMSQDPVGTVHRLLSDASVDPEEAMKWIGEHVGWKGQDPKWQVKIDSLRGAYQGAKARAFAMLSRYPNMSGLDEYNSAFKEVGEFRGGILGDKGLAPYYANATAAYAAGDQPATAKAFAILNEQVNAKWDKYWEYAISRMDAAAFRIAESNLPKGTLEALKFTPAGATDEWQLLGPSLKFKNQWDVMAADGRKSVMAVLSKKNAIGVPQALIDQFNVIRQGSERELWDQLGRMGANAEQSFPGAGDEVIKRLQSKSKDMVGTIRQRVAEYMANYNQQQFVPHDIQGWYRMKMEAGQQALNSVLEKVADANATGHGRMGLDTISEFNQKVLPHFDNVVTGAQEYGKQMLSLGMVDFTNNYHPDVLLSVGAPYHYWWTRMGKNAVERLIFSPKVPAMMAEFLRGVESINRAQGQPNRNVDTLPAGVTIGDTQYRPGATVIANWIPFAANMIMNGYADPDVANRSFEYGNEAATNEAFPNTKNQLFANASYAYELAKQLGLNTFGDVDAAVEAANGNQLAWQGKLGDISPLYRTLGYGAVRLANWAKDNHYELPQQLAQGFASATIPGYFPYLVGRNASFDAQRGNLSDQQAQMVQDVGRQDYTGLSPMPEQAFMDPQAAQQYEDLQNKTANEYFIRSLISFLTSVPVAASYGPEMKLRQAQALQKLSGYDPAVNPAGSQAAKFGFTTPGNENYTQGLAPFNSQYAVTSESAPNMPDPSVKRPGLTATQAAYYAERDAIYKKYEDAAQAAYTAHPEWADRTTSGPAKDFKDAQYAAKQKELGDLDIKYPTISAQEKGSAQYSESAARPREVVNRAQQRLYSQANKNIPYPPDGSPAAAYDAHDAALEAEVNRLMGQPGNVLYNEPGNVSRDIGRHPRGESNVRSVLPAQENNAVQASTATGATNPVAEANNTVPLATSPTNAANTPGGSVVPGGTSPYASDFAAAEQANGLPTGLLGAVQANETTDGNVKAVSDAGAQGLMQVMPDTWKEWAPKVGATDPNNPQDSIKVAAAYLAWLQATLPKDKQDVKSLAIAYNFGIGNVLNGKTPPPETLAYANRIANAVQNVPGGQPPDGNVQSVPGTTQTIANPYSGKVEGPYTVVTTPITDTGKTWVSPVPAGTPVYQWYGDTQTDGLGPYYAKVNKGFGHEGIDWMLPEGTHINSVADGTVVWASDGTKAGRPAYGNLIIVDNGNGYRSLYGHLSAFNVKVGDTVTAGQYIGDVGHTPLSSNIGSHLHLAIEDKNENTGPWNTIDPFRLIGQGAQPSGTTPGVASQATSPVASTATAASTQPPTETPVSAQVPVASPVPPVGAATSPAVTTLPTATNNAGAFPWGGTAKDIIASQSTANKAPAQAAAEASVNQQYADIDARAVAAYPQGAGLYQEYRTLTDDQKKPWAAAHPLIKAMHLAGYDPAEYSYMEKNFGKGVVEKWANIPPYTGEGDDSASKYYHANPDVFVAKSWLQGRPEVHDDSTFDPNQPFEYDAGKDYDTARSMFGDGIWDTVRQYYSIPLYVKGGDNKAWIDFKTNHPEYDSWRTWWYANLPGQQASTFGQYQGRGGYASHGHGNGYGQSSHGVGVDPVAFWRQSPPQFQAPGNGDSGWRQWLALTESDLKNWRR